MINWGIIIMNLHGTDLSEEKQELEEAIRQLGFIPNHNYF